MLSILRPEIYHGRNKRPPFFEGWYFKLVDRSGHHRFALIPGVFLHPDPATQHAFIQILDGTAGPSRYHRYPFSDFGASAGTFDIRIGANRISDRSMTIDIEREGHSVRGSLTFTETKPWPVSLASPGIMGWYAWVPFMECYHAVVSLDHAIDGSLTVNGTEIDFSGGRGYIEKDWGRSFPHAHIWIQSNHFPAPKTSLTASVAIIPWIRTSFPGFIVGFLMNGHLYRFATYTGARITRLEVSDDQIQWAMRDKRYELVIRATRSTAGLLHAPTVTAMTDRLLESLTSKVNVILKTHGGDVLFDGEGLNAGVEIGGAIRELIALWKSDDEVKRRVP